MILVNFNLLSKNKVYKTEIVDECSFIVGNLIHKISDGDACKLACITECQFLKKEYFSHSFLKKEESCNKCYCECLG